MHSQPVVTYFLKALPIAILLFWFIFPWPIGIMELWNSGIVGVLFLHLVEKKRNSWDKHILEPKNTM